MKQTIKFMAFFVISSFVIPLISVYFGLVFEQLARIFAGLMGIR